MEYRQLGRSGLKVSLVALGGNTFGPVIDATKTAEILGTARELGINTVDTADVYSAGQSEEHVGKAIAENRHDWVIMTKYAAAMPGAMFRGVNSSRGYMRKAVEASLSRLGTDYIDLYQVHQWDPSTPIEETISGLNDLVREGKVNYIGCSNWPSWAVAEANLLAAQHGWAPFVSSQPRYNVIDRSIEAEHVPACLRYGVGLIPWSPLAGGFLTGKHRRGEEPAEGTRMANSPWARAVLTDRNFDRLERLQGFAAQRGITMTQLAIGWLAAQPVVSTIIIGATRPEQVRENVEASEVKLTAEDIAGIDAAFKGED
jgi:aryl-alcohol dehydrogenase-like predicted oxidoreductase